MEMPTADELAEDIGLLMMSTIAFNMGIGARADRDPASVDRLDLAVRRVGETFNISIEA